MAKNGEGGGSPAIACLHTSNGDNSTIEIVGLPSTNMAGMNVLWLF